MAIEINFDAIVGPTHNYAGLSYGNLASEQHKQTLSHPRKAALEGLAKMKLLHDLGIMQGIIPPQLRPSISHLRLLGFTGAESEIIKNAAKEAPLLLRACSSTSSMWAANSATVCPSSDSLDGKVHLSIANLSNRFHRSLESEATLETFRRIFPEKHGFVIHPPLPKGGHFGDEGAANHIRFCKRQGGRGVHLFVYGQKCFEEGTETGRKPLRQSLEASQAVARLHGLKEEQVVFAKQNQEVIEQGVFHNDVISFGHENLFIVHEKAFEEPEKVIAELSAKLQEVAGAQLSPILISESTLSVKRAIETYFFNGQLVTLKDQRRLLLLPEECRGLEIALPVDQILYTKIHESMKNGGGPACLRLRVVLTQEELLQVNPHYLFSDALYEKLTQWVKKHYRETLGPDDLGDPSLYEESKQALLELSAILGETCFSMIR